ncbi:MAG TPA: NeuD/PglB/VioB family sugar acetyltransferase [Cyclobacteriaceae bacterium]|nr:NeuD/PglB/VioB family sugar acetyltransferase [Cyclobacteriaceae bacterium]HRJ80902.1 NeuD/PglB/VioB family sugar acetyltransferase [Cyclobacteriaceae bacterium]
MDNPVLIFGTSYLGRIAREIFEVNGNVVYGFLDDDNQRHGKEIDGIVVLGNTDDDGFLKLIGKKCEAFVAVDDNRFRKTLVKMLNEVRHVQPVNAIHRDALLASHVELGHGNLIDSGVKIGVGAKLGSHCILQCGALIGAEASLGDFAQIGSGSIINSGVRIEPEAFIGSGVTIVSGVTIGKGARVGAGAVVIAPVKDGETVFGNPAQPIKQ